MFFILSKALWALAAPSTFLIALIALGALLLFTRFARWGRRAVAGGVLALAILATGVPGTLAMRVLEERFPRPEKVGEIAGIIVLGGAVDEFLTAARGPVALTDSAERMTEGVALARLYPQARIVFSGGTASLFDTPLTEAAAARLLWRSLGLEDARVVYEDRSRNTQENARFTRDLVQPKPGEKWLLLTSAYHMPRSMGLFRAAGFDVLPWPVDYRTQGGPRDVLPLREASQGLMRSDVALREWIGLIAYRLTGRIAEFFPAP